MKPFLLTVGLEMRILGLHFRFPASAYLVVIFFLLAFLKVAAYVYIGEFSDGSFLGGGNDSNYYNAYALGYTDIRVHFWPVVLRTLHDFGLYSRDGVSTFLKLLAIFIIPILVGRLVLVKPFPYGRRVFWSAVVLIGCYPTIFYFAMDIYRDNFMLMLYLLGLFFLRKFIFSSRIANKTVFVVICIFFSFLMFLERGYLGFSFFAAFVLLRFYRFDRFPFWLSVFLLLVSLNALYAIGILDPVLNYRDGFADTQGSSNLGITFGSALTFVPIFLKSFFMQVFGFGFSGWMSIIVFFAESLPFIMAIVYVINNRKYSNKFVDFLLIFFVIYSSVWVIGNDNLGTAVRIRVFNYISIYIAFFVVFQNKFIALKNSEDAKRAG